MIGARIKQLRKKHNMRQVDLAAVLNINQSTLANYENDKRTVSNDILLRIANFFNVSTDYLLEQTEYTHPQRDFYVLAQKQEDYFLSRMADRSMEPNILLEDTLIVKRQDTIADGQIVAYTYGDDEKVEIRQIKKNKYGITFVSYNTSLGEPLFFTHEELAKSSIQILGRVIELRRAI